MEAFYDFVRRLIRGFEGAGLDYAFTGALAVSFYGVPRTTVDVDVVVYVPEGRHKEKLVYALKMAGLTVDEKEIEKALKSGYRIATFKDAKTPYSVDVILSEKAFEKKVGTVAGLRAFFQTPQDLILAKLRMIKATVPRERAFKDEEDVKAILKFTEVDVDAVREQAKRDSTIRIFEAIIR
ncbi:MAG: hypothetical protein ACUVQX_07040 [Candidatus Bathycorpusculaceae bacterium]